MHNAKLKIDLKNTNKLKYMAVQINNKSFCLWNRVLRCCANQISNILHRRKVCVNLDSHDLNI